MKPINTAKENCIPTSSNCVKWPAIKIEGLELCRDASVTEVILALSDKLKDIINALNIDSYELKCLENAKCGPQEFSDLVQLIIDKLCKLESNNGTDLSSLSMIIEPECFVDFNSGDKEIVISTYANLIAEKVCDIYEQLATLNTQIASMSEAIELNTIEINNLQTEKQDALHLTSEGQEVEDTNSFLQEQCELVNEHNRILGQDLVDSMCENTESLSSSGNLNTVDNNTVIGNIHNLWRFMCDARAAIQTLQSLSKLVSMSIQAIITCEHFYYKASVDVQTTKSKIGGFTLNGQSYPVESFDVTASNQWETLLDLDGNSSHSIIPNASFDIEYEDNSIPRGQHASFSIVPAVSNFQFTEDTQTVSLVKNISHKKVGLYRRLNSTDTLLCEFQATETGTLSFQDTTVLVPHNIYTYFARIEGDDAYCNSADFECPPYKTVTPQILDGEYTQDDVLEINTVEPSDYNSWYNKLTE